MIIKILSEKDFLDLLYGDWTYTDEAKKALYKYYNNTESNFIFNSTQILSDWKEYSSIESANEKCTGDYEVEAYTLVLHCKGGSVMVKDF